MLYSSVEIGEIIIGADRKGLPACAAIVAHEMYHGTIAKNSSGKSDLDPARNDEDVLGDLIADELEPNDAGFKTSTLRKDTYGMSRVWGWSDYARYGDNEVRARMIERVEAKKWYNKDLDWSNPGFQSAVSGAYDNYSK